MKVAVNAVTAGRVLSELMKLKQATDGLNVLKDQVNVTVVGLIEASITDTSYDPEKLDKMDMDHISEGYVILEMKEDEVEAPLEG